MEKCPGMLFRRAEAALVKSVLYSPSNDIFYSPEAYRLSVGYISLSHSMCLYQGAQFCLFFVFFPLDERKLRLIENHDKHYGTILH